MSSRGRRRRRRGAKAPLQGRAAPAGPRGSWGCRELPRAGPVHDLELALEVLDQAVELADPRGGRAPPRGLLLACVACIGGDRERVVDLHTGIRGDPWVGLEALVVVQ